MNDEYYMSMALKEAQKAKAEGEVPIGAVLVRENKILARARNQRERLKNPLSHAELEVIRKASKKLKNWRLSNSTLYVTVEPCAMCAGAIIQSRINRLVYGAEDKKAGACGSILNLLEDKKFNHQVEVTRGIGKKEAKKLLQDFFKDLREKDRKRPNEELK